MRKGRDGIGGFWKKVGCGVCFTLLRPWVVVDAFCFGEECPKVSLVSDSFCSPVAPRQKKKEELGFSLDLLACSYRLRYR